MTEQATSYEPPSLDRGGPIPPAPSASLGGLPVGDERAGAGLRADGLSKRWGQRLVLDDASLALTPGTTAWIGGRNGAGKTTLLRILAGLIVADRGEVRIGDLRPHRDRRRYQESIGLLSAGDRGLYARLSVRHNLQLWARLALLPRDAREAAVEAAIAMLQLQELADARVDRLSLGQRQRVRLALCFLHSPSLVLLDEPGNSLDDDGLALLAAAVGQLTRGGGIAIWCAPSRPDVDAIQAGYVLADGQLATDR